MSSTQPVVCTTIAEFQSWRSQYPSQTVGFVPTMGALHSGHGELLKKAKTENDLLVLSIFVNPTQFNDPNDLAKYPKTTEADLALAKSIGVDCVFLPNNEIMYPHGYHYKVCENALSLKLCGAHRPGHFDGVLSIVMKLFQITQAQRAYFGEKDYQQLSLIRGMVQDFFLPIEIISVPTVREQDGLAMSSRNKRLTEEERTQAPQLYQILTTSSTASEASQKLTEAGFRVDYVEDISDRRFAAAFLGEVRLIDNVKI